MLTNAGKKIISILEKENINNEIMFKIKKELASLEKDSIKVDILEDAGVSNWENYGLAMKNFYKEIKY